VANIFENTVQQKSIKGTLKNFSPVCFASYCLVCFFGCAEMDDGGINGIDVTGQDEIDVLPDYSEGEALDEQPDEDPLDSSDPDLSDAVEYEIPGDDGGQTEGGIGSACDSAGDCTDPGSECLSHPIVFPGGYCTIRDCTPGSCPIGSGCQGETDFLCLKYCEDEHDCRYEEGYRCLSNYCIKSPL